MATNPYAKYLAAPSPAGDPVIAVDPYKVEDQAMDRERLRLAQESSTRATAAAERAAGADERSAAAAERAENAATRLPQGDSEALRKKISAFGKLFRTGQEFKDDYAGFGAGVENTVQGWTGLGTPGQRDWWANFRAADNLIRNELFGASLSGGEKQAYGETTVTPNMAPSEVRQNIARRAREAKDELGRIVRSLDAAGYNRQQIDALLGEYAPIIRGSTQSGTRDDEAAPAAIGAPVAPSATGNSPPPPAAGSPPLLSFGGGPAGYTPATGATREVPIPELNARLDGMFRAGASYEDLNQEALRAGAEPMNPQQYSEWRAYLRSHPNYQGGIFNARRFEPVSGFERAATAIGSSAPGAYAIGAGQFLSGNTLDNLTEDPARARLAMDIVEAQNPTASAIGQISGGMMAAGAGEAALARAGIGNALGRGILADAAMGGANGAGMADEGGRGMNALRGAGAAIAGNLTGNALTRGIRGVANPAVRAMQEAGVPMTVGQTFGQSGRIGAAVRGIEDRLSGLPVVGDAINARRREGIEKFNERAFTKALDPIGGQIQGKIGEEAVAEAQSQVSDAFNKALGGRAAALDKPFQGQMTAALNQAAQLPRVGREVIDGIRDVMEPYFGKPHLTGQEMQQISRELQALKSSYASDPLSRRINKAVNSADDALMAMFDRQFAGMIPEYTAAKEAHRKVSILQDAVLAAKNADGVFTPAQLGRADKANTVKFSGKAAAARGDGPFHDYQRAAQTVLPGKVPDSGTAGRLLVPGIAAAAIGGDAALGDGVNPATLTLGAAFAGAYSKAGQRLLSKAGRGAKPDSLLRRPAAQRAITAGGGALGAFLGTQ